LEKTVLLGGLGFSGIMGGRVSNGQAACHTAAHLHMSYGLLFQSQARRARAHGGRLARCFFYLVLPPCLER